MQKRIEAILGNMCRYNGGDIAGETFGLSADVHYDALVIAPSWKPTKILDQNAFSVRTLAQHSWLSGYEVITGDRRLGWIQCASGACNLIDHLAVCTGLDYKQLIFLGAAGSLTAKIPVGTVCTPSVSIAGNMAEAYLLDNPLDYKPFRRVYPNDQAYVDKVCTMADFPIVKAPTFCTDSIACEYSHLDFIRSFGAELIEMESSAFYAMAAMLEKPAVALFAVSDNSASGQPLLCKDTRQEAAYNQGRKVNIPRLLEKLANA